MSDPDSPVGQAVGSALPVVSEAPFGVTEKVGARILNLSDRQAAIQADLVRLRAHAMKRDPTNKDGVGDGMAISHPVLFAAVIDRQIRALDLGLKIGQEVYDIERVREYLSRVADLIANRIGNLAPDVQAVILNDIQALNEEFLVGGSGGAS